MDDEDSTIVALMHDVVEDSNITFNDLRSYGFSDSIIDALKLLTYDKDEDYFCYIRRVKENQLAAKVKLADLRHNSDLSRLKTISNDDNIRMKKYTEAIELLDFMN